jgi:superfamily II DNA or RNA helicase/HKD family nuclease
MARIDTGLYETLVTDDLDRALAELDRALVAEIVALTPAEAHDRLALFVARFIERAVKGLPQEERSNRGVALARDLVERICAQLGLAGLIGERPIAEGRVLRAVSGRQPDGTLAHPSGPHMPLLDTALVTNATGEPHIGAQLCSEIPSADAIDLVMAFVHWTGIRNFVEPLRRHCESGRPLRVLTTTYMESTQQRALDALRTLGANVRVSYDTSGTRLHAKAWLFQRRGGYSTAYIGSSNLTHSAQVTGLEWNVRVSEARNPVVVDRVRLVFDSYWASSDFEPYEPHTFAARVASQAKRRTSGEWLSPTEVRPEPFQERLLEQIALARSLGHHRNLLVSATGTGKTVMAALDYARLSRVLPRARLLFVAHREEILEQSRRTFCQVLREPDFGELWVGGHRPRAFEHVFASIQSLAANGLEHLAPDHFDVVLVDEFHHAAAETYSRLLDRVTPVELLGLTATPERADGRSILHHFGGRIAAELRVWDAIDQRRLVPFSYYGIHDGTDLRDIPWRRGRGYDAEGLTNLLTSTDAWARIVFQQLVEKVGDPESIRALGFCVSVDHARYMARVFDAWGLRAVAVSADTPEEDRKRALRDLERGHLRVVFSVDLFNEGVDLPSVDTLLMLRPTDSGTLFLQQLGRGLRRAPGKTLCTVLDFVGFHRREFRFDRKLNALLQTSRKGLSTQVELGFPLMPSGCSMHLDGKSREVALRSLREGIARTWRNKVDELDRLVRQRRDVDLETFLEETGLELSDVFADAPKRTWQGLRADAGLAVPIRADGPTADTLDKAVARLLHVDDPERLEIFRRWVSAEHPPHTETLSPRETRLARMLLAPLVGATRVVDKSASLDEAFAALWRHPRALADLSALFGALANRLTHLAVPLTGRDAVPLAVHARYTRDEVLAAYGEGHAVAVPEWREGVRYMKGERVDAFLFTLDKTDGTFSPTTRYNDYAISAELIHWESQSGTRETSPTGLRYQNHVAQGSEVHLFARATTDERAFFFLGPASYVSHLGELPMKITWRLVHPLPGDLYAAFAAAVA